MATTKEQLETFADKMEENIEKQFNKFNKVSETFIKKQGTATWNKYKKHVRTMDHTRDMKLEALTKFSPFLPDNFFVETWNRGMAVTLEFWDTEADKEVREFMKEHNIGVMFNNKTLDDFKIHELLGLLRALIDLDIDELKRQAA